MSEPQEVLALPESGSSDNGKRAATGTVTVLSPSSRENFIAPDPLLVSFKTSFTGSVTVYIYLDVSFGWDDVM